MAKKEIKELAAEVERVRGELEEWRGQRRRGQRIPEELWSAAVQAARGHGLNHVSRALGLDYYQLKRRSELGEEKAQTVRGNEQTFVELVDTGVELAEAKASCVIELEKGNGVRMRICVRDAATVDWGRMKEAFLGA